MASFAIALARSGYLAVSFDYYGHGRNLEPLRGNVTEIDGATRYLLNQTQAVVEFALALPDASGELALLGHSMASDIVVRYAQQDPRVDATIAVSMFSPEVTASEPHKLLVIVGNLEGFLKLEALRVLGMVTDNPQPGVTVVDGESGDARRVAFAEGVEHVGVLFSETSLHESVAWLDGVYGRETERVPERRGPWIGLLLIGLCALAWPLSRCLPVVSSPPKGAALGWRQLLPVALLPAVGTPLILWHFPADFLGVLVGGYLAVHFALYGVLTLACLWWVGRAKEQQGQPVSRRRLSAATLLATTYTAGAIGLAIDSYVTSFAIPGLRLPLLGVMLAGTLLYFLADEWMVHGAATARGGHLFARLCFLTSLGIAVALSYEDLLFLLIIAAVIVIYFLIYGFFSRWTYQRTGHPAVGAIANAVAFAVALTAVFPIMAGP